MSIYGFCIAYPLTKEGPLTTQAYLINRGFDELSATREQFAKLSEALQSEQNLEREHGDHRRFFNSSNDHQRVTATMAVFIEVEACYGLKGLHNHSEELLRCQCMLTAYESDNLP